LKKSRRPMRYLPAIDSSHTICRAALLVDAFADLV
jgi:hypothetical protein